MYGKFTASSLGVPTSWEVRISRNYQDGMTSVTYIDGNSDKAPAWVCKPSEGELNTGTMPFSSTSFLENAASPALAPKPGSSVPPHVSLMAFKQLPKSWSSKQVILSMNQFMCRSFTKKIFDSLSLPSYSATISANLYRQNLWGIFFLTLELWVGDSGVRPGPLAPSQGTSEAELFLSMLNPHTLV